MADIVDTCYGQGFLGGTGQDPARVDVARPWHDAHLQLVPHASVAPRTRRRGLPAMRQTRASACTSRLLLPLERLAFPLQSSQYVHTDITETDLTLVVICRRPCGGTEISGCGSVIVCGFNLKEGAHLRDKRLLRWSTDPLVLRHALVFCAQHSTRKPVHSPFAVLPVQETSFSQRSCLLQLQRLHLRSASRSAMSCGASCPLCRTGGRGEPGCF